MLQTSPDIRAEAAEPGSGGGGRADGGTRPRVSVLQDGARRHYIVPIVLQQAGMLERVFTDWYAGRDPLEVALRWAVGRIDPKTAARMSQRRNDMLDARAVRHHPLMAIRQRRARPRFGDDESFYRWQSHQCGDWVLRQGLGDCNAFYGFIRNASEKLFAECRRRGIATVGDQMIAPAVIEEREMRLQDQRFAGWEPMEAKHDYSVVIEVERASWENCDHIVCGSDYVRDGLIEQGIAPGKVTTMLYAPMSAGLDFVDRRGRDGPLRVGFVGAVSLRKGAPYFMQVAGRFDPREAVFTMVGPVLVDQAKAAAAVTELGRGNVTLTGSVPRKEVKERLKGFDVLLFPSTCEGSAGAVLEAMATGLPIVSTPNSGTIVRDGVEGYLCRYDDIDAMEQAIRRLKDDAGLRHAMGTAARRRVEVFAMDAYAAKLGALMGSVVNRAR